MKFWVGVTDNNWFKFQSLNAADEVNFWQPGGRPAFKSAPTGMPFLFKLKRPHNHIAGGGFFVTFTTLPLSLAWEIFGPKNGAKSLDDLRNLVAPLRSEFKLNDEIGCTVLSNCFYMDPETWISDPPGWSSNIVQGKGYETGTGEGWEIWNGVRSYLEKADELKLPTVVDKVGFGVAEPADVGAKYGSPSLVRPRIGQSAFSRLLKKSAFLAAFSPARKINFHCALQAGSPAAFRRPFRYHPQIHCAAIPPLPHPHFCPTACPGIRSPAQWDGANKLPSRIRL